MSQCFVSLCNHRFGKSSKVPGCKPFRFPFNDNIRKKWDKLCRRADRKATFNDRICSCHFQGGLKENGPTVFHWNEKKLFTFPSPQKRVRKQLLQPVTTPSKWRDEVEMSSNVLASNTEHDHGNYCHPCQEESCISKLQQLNGMVSTLREEIAELEQEIHQLKIKKQQMSYDQLKFEENMVIHYTSLQTDVFDILADLLHQLGPFNYYLGWSVKSLSLQDQLLVTLIKLRHNFKDLHLSMLFNTSCTTISNVIHTIVAALHEALYEGVISQGMPSLLKCKGSMPKSFDCFPTARVAMDATEITQDIPSALDLKNICYSNYKSRHTVKSVTCVAPNAAIVYASVLYPCSTSDKAIVEHTGLLNQFRPGDLILADKGFTLYDILPQGVSLNIPAFLSNKSHFTKEEAKLCFKIAKARIHVERANERIKNFEILNHIPQHYRSFSTKIFQLCCALVNVQAPLIKEVADKYEM